MRIDYSYRKMRNINIIIIIIINIIIRDDR